MVETTRCCPSRRRPERPQRSGCGRSRAAALLTLTGTKQSLGPRERCRLERLLHEVLRSQGADNTRVRAHVPLARGSCRQRDELQRRRSAGHRHLEVERARSRSACHNEGDAIAAAAPTRLVSSQWHAASASAYIVREIARATAGDVRVEVERQRRYDVRARMFACGAPGRDVTT